MPTQQRAEPLAENSGSFARAAISGTLSGQRVALCPREIAEIATATNNNNNNSTYIYVYTYSAVPMRTGPFWRDCPLIPLFRYCVAMRHSPRFPVWTKKPVSQSCRMAASRRSGMRMLFGPRCDKRVAVIVLG
jgi:hypothetical protein